jgi:hypothetical protein
MFTDASIHPYQGITNIHLSIHADIPAGEVAPWSMPQIPPLWEADVDPAAPWPGWTVLPPQEEVPSWQGWFDPNTGMWETNNHDLYFKYEIFIPDEEAFYQTNGTIYWLDISVETTNGLWGWKTTTNHWNDDAVWADLPVTNLNQWHELLSPTNEFESLDLAFIINEHEPEVDWGDAPDPTYPTLNLSGGANHTILPGMYLGMGVDGEPDGQPNGTATGDDQNINGLGGIAFPPGDEDGVAFTQLVPGLPATITVTASMAGNLDAWIDYNGNGSWDASEQLTGASIPLLAGANLINITVPASATPTLSTFARFRYSSAGGLAPAGPAPDGEVEDYEVMIDDPIDWGDAPDSPYPTLNTSAGAAHLIGGPYLGVLVDPELDGQPTLLADGDDIDLLGPSLGDDEDGVAFTTQLIPGAVAQLDVVLNGSAAAVLDAWVDFNADGDWLDSGEQIFTSFILGSGTNGLFFTVPAAAKGPTNTYARFRISSAGGLAPTGYAQDGEVEDYMVDVEEPQSIDWGDAPASYQTLDINNGAHHVVAGAFLGSSIDAETNGIPSVAADGDDLDNTDDEDGIIFISNVQPGGYARMDVLASGAGILDAWVDFDNNGSWAEPADRIFNNQPLLPGTNMLYFGVPLVATNIAPTTTYARLRFSSSGVSGYAGLALDGEVEDHTIDVAELEIGGPDYGDAPDSYSTYNASGGARHTIVPGIMLGAMIDNETDGQPNATATGDDVDIQGDDEDGVVFNSKIVGGTNTSVTVTAGVLGGKLDAWIDLNADGDWLDSGEKVVSGQTVGSGLNTLSIPVPFPSAIGQSFARFRISSAGTAAPTGPAADGEVEDYRVDLYQPGPTNLVITNIFLFASNTTAQVEWTAQSNIVYQMQSSTNLISHPWTNTGSQVTGPANWQTNSAAPNAQFYRVIAPWTP